MRDLFFKLFEMSHFDTGIKITAFSVPHIVYMVLIIGAIVGAWLVLRKKSDIHCIIIILGCNNDSASICNTSSRF